MLSPANPESIQRDGALLAMVAICTYKRPKMLAACFESIIGQELPDNVILHVVVIDNDSMGSGHVPYIRIAGKTGIWTTYLREPTRGIASARNKAIDFALEQEADYLLYLDDDETADHRWIAGMMKPEYLETGILQGNRIMTSDHIPEAFRPKPGSTKHEQGDLIKLAYTHNIRIHNRLLKAGLRFDTDFNLSGGEDEDFSIRAGKLGEEIRFIKTAITWEPIQFDRLNLFYDFNRERAIACNKIRIKAKYGSLSKWKYALSAAYLNFIGTWLVLIGESIQFLSKETSTKLIRKGIMKVAKGNGQWHGIKGIQLKLYEEITGE